MNDADQRVCDERHGNLETELFRIRGKLDGNGTEGVVARLKGVEDNVKDMAEVKRQLRVHTLLLVGLALLSGGNVSLKALEILKLIP